MVSIEIDLVREVSDWLGFEGQMLLIFSIIISFIGSIYSNPEAWGLMGLIISKIKHSEKSE